MAILNVLGLDPSLRNWGIAAGQYCTVTEKLVIKSIRVIRAEVPDGKQVRQNSKDLATAEQLYAGVKPFLGKVNLIFAEVPVGSQSARAMASYGVCVGILGAVRYDTPFFEVTPDEVKRSTVGNKTATKKQMIDWAVAAHPEAPWPRTTKGVIVEGKAEHMADAIASIYAGLQSNQYKQLAAMRIQ